MPCGIYRAGRAGGAPGSPPPSQYTTTPPNDKWQYQNGGMELGIGISTGTRVDMRLVSLPDGFVNFEGFVGGWLSFVLYYSLSIVHCSLFYH